MERAKDEPLGPLTQDQSSVGQVTDARAEGGAGVHVYSEDRLHDQLSGAGSMQERFKQFREEAPEARMRKYISKKGKRSQAVKDPIRRKFLAQVESYVGVLTRKNTTSLARQTTTLLCFSTAARPCGVLSMTCGGL